MAILNNSNLGFFSALIAVKPDSGRHVAQTLWSVICASIFFSQDGYVSALNGPVMEDGTTQAIYELKSIAKEGVSGELIERQILIMEIKSASEDTPSEWRRSLDEQLVPYLDQMASNTNGRVYAAIAIGSRVRFWQWDGKAKIEGASKIQLLHEVAYDMHTVGGCEKVEEVLVDIKKQGWEWTS